jgi:hypothetical protein
VELAAAAAEFGAVVEFDAPIEAACEEFAEGVADAGTDGGKVIAGDNAGKILVVPTGAEVGKGEELETVFDCFFSDFCEDCEGGGSELGVDEKAAIKVELSFIVASDAGVASNSKLLAGKEVAGAELEGGFEGEEGAVAERMGPMACCVDVHPMVFGSRA